MQEPSSDLAPPLLSALVSTFDQAVTELAAASVDEVPVGELLEQCRGIVGAIKAAVGSHGQDDTQQLWRSSARLWVSRSRP